MLASGEKCSVQVSSFTNFHLTALSVAQDTQYRTWLGLYLYQVKHKLRKIYQSSLFKKCQWHQFLFSHFGFLHHMSGECHGVSEEHPASIYKVTELFQLFHFSIHFNNSVTVKIEALYFSETSEHLTTTWSRSPKKGNHLFNVMHFPKY
jgi:hypothetical protein